MLELMFNLGKNFIMAEKINFGSHKGTDLHQFILKNKNNMEVSVTEWGAIITSIKVLTDEGMRECVLGFDSIEDYTSEEYLSNYPYLGAIIGRNAGRISSGRFPLNGQEIQVTVNHGEHHLHGGSEGFDKKIWKVEEVGDHSVTLSYVSKDGEEGYPGNVSVKVIYTLNDDNELKVEYFAETDQPTPVNLTQHSYFNFNAEDSGDILTHHLTVNSDQYVPLNENLLPTGEISKTENTRYDYTKPKNPSEDLDNSFVNKNNNTVIGSLKSADGKVQMEVISSYPVLHLYTGYYLPEISPKNRKKLGKNAGICFEAQGFADAPNRLEFPSTILNPNEKYQHSTIFKFIF